MALFRLVRLFFWECWDRGLRIAFLLVAQRLRRTRSFPQGNAASPFPPIPSNSGAYLPLLKLRPLVSIVMPVHNSHWLAEAVASVLAQTYADLELILVDDASTDPVALAALDSARADSRVRVLKNDTNLGISAATNVGIEAAAGSYVAFMDHDDLLHPDALAFIVRTLNNGRDADVFYTDELRMNARGTPVALMRKCPISMDLLLSCNAVLHFCVMKKASLQRIGLLKSEYDGAQDHELMVRALEHGLTFEHVPCVVYAWRIHDRSASEDTRRTPDGGRPYPKAYASGRRMIEDYLARHQIAATLTDDVRPWYRVKYSLPPQEEEVAIIVPFKDKVSYLRRLLTSLELTRYTRTTLYLVNNRSEKPETAQFLREVAEAGRVKVIDFDEPFNYSRLHNTVVRRIPNELLLFLNNDIEVTDPEWLHAMLEHIHRPNVAAVGARLTRGDGTLQHAGMVFRPTISTCAGNLHVEDEYYTRVQRDVSGVTAACMLIRRSVFEAIGGFDEVQFPIGFSDADLCLKILQAGHKILYTPFARLSHHESKSRFVQEESYEIFNLFRKYVGDTPLRDGHYVSLFANDS